MLQLQSTYCLNYFLSNYLHPFFPSFRHLTRHQSSSNWFEIFKSARFSTVLCYIFGVYFSATNIIKGLQLSLLSSSFSFSFLRHFFSRLKSSVFALVLVLTFIVLSSWNPLTFYYLLLLFISIYLYPLKSVNFFPYIQLLSHKEKQYKIHKRTRQILHNHYYFLTQCRQSPCKIYLAQSLMGKAHKLMSDSFKHSYWTCLRVQHNNGTGCCRL